MSTAKDFEIVGPSIQEEAAGEVEEGKPETELLPLPQLANRRQSIIRTIDDFTNMGNYAFLIILFTEFILLAGAGNMVYMVFAGAAPKSVNCLEHEEPMNICKMNDTNYRTINCTLAIDYEFKSVNVEFNYLCNEGKIVKSFISAEMMGVLLGTLLFGNLSDIIGRKKVLLISYTFVSFFSLCVSFAPRYFWFVVFRTLLGFFNGGIVSTYSVYKMEHIAHKHRFWVATIIAWAPNFILINIFAYFAGNWRSFQRLIFYISTPAIPLFFYVYESPRFLIQRGRIAEAREVLQNIQRIDGVSAKSKEHMERMIENEYEKHLARKGRAKIHTVVHLFATEEMTIATIVLCLGAFFTSMINYGLVFNFESLSGSLFINSIIMGVLRWTTNIISGVLDYKYKCVGRKAVHFLSQATIALSLLTVTILIAFGLTNEFALVNRTALIIASATTSQVFISKSISALEFYPTVVRNQAMALKSMSSRIGTIAAPLLFIVSPWKIFPFIIISAMSIIDTIAFEVSIPETKGKNLPDTIEEMREKSRKKSSSKAQTQILEPLVKPVPIVVKPNN